VADWRGSPGFHGLWVCWGLMGVEVCSSALEVNCPAFVEDSTVALGQVVIPSSRLLEHLFVLCSSDPRYPSRHFCPCPFANRNDNRLPPFDHSTNVYLWRSRFLEAISRQSLRCSAWKSFFVRRSVPRGFGSPEHKALDLTSLAACLAPVAVLSTTFGHSPDIRERHRCDRSSDGGQGRRTRHWASVGILNY